MLAGVHALKEELTTVSAKRGKFPAVVGVLSAGVSVLREMIGQVSAIDVEFAETWPAVFFLRGTVHVVV